MRLVEVLELRDEVALLDPSENPDGAAAMAASNVLAVHNAIVTGDIQPPDGAA